MCGRFTVTVSNELLEEYLQDAFGIQTKAQFNLPRYNVAPGQEVIAIISDGNKNRVGTLHWGFVPPFAKDEKIGFKMINARSETIMEKPSFKPSFITKRCLILADSFYEWKRKEKEKIPYRFLLKDQTLFTMAGIYTTYIRDDGTKHHSCSIITTKANALLHEIHERMPVILTKHDRDAWLNPKTQDLEYLQNVLIPYDATNMRMYQVSQVVNNAKSDTAECIKEV
jgi:putative SOS response-associated peptidase YedK